MLTARVTLLGWDETGFRSRGPRFLPLSQAESTDEDCANIVIPWCRLREIRLTPLTENTAILFPLAFRPTASQLFKGTLYQ